MHRGLGSHLSFPREIARAAEFRARSSRRYAYQGRAAITVTAVRTADSEDIHLNHFDAFPTGVNSRCSMTASLA